MDILEKVKKLQELKKQSEKPAPFNKGDGDQRWEQLKKKEAFDLIDDIMSSALGEDWLDKPAALILLLEYGRGLKQYQEYLKLS